MANFKYIVVRNTCGEVPILFPDTYAHCDIHPSTGIESAGYVTFYNGEITCWGESTTLNLKSRKEIDANLIRYMLNDKRLE